MKIEQCGGVIKYEDEHECCSIEIDSDRVCYSTDFNMVIRIGEDGREVKLDPLTVSVMIQQLQKIKTIQEKDNE